MRHLIYLFIGCLWIGLLCGAEQYEWVLAPVTSPTSTPIFTVPNVGVFDMLGTRTTIPNPFPAHVQGVFFSVAWTEIEHAGAGQFDWTPITSITSQLHAGQYAQVVINVGAYGSPMNANSCLGISNCVPWLGNEGTTGVTILSDQGNNGSSHGYPVCTPLIDPDPTDTHYQTEWKAMVAAAATQWNTNPAFAQIASLMIVPFSNLGGNLALAVTSTCQTVTTNTCSNSSNQCYNAAWNTKSGCAGQESPCWTNYLENAFNTLWDYEVAQFGTHDNSLWVNPLSFPKISGANDASLDNSIRNAMFAHMSATVPAGPKYYINNEALQDSNTWANAVSNVNTSTGNYGAQMARAFCGNKDTQCETDGSCANLLTAANTWALPPYPTANWIEIYFNDVAQCTTEIQAISAAHGGS